MTDGGFCADGLGGEVLPQAAERQDDEQESAHRRYDLRTGKESGLRRHARVTVDAPWRQSSRRSAARARARSGPRAGQS